MRVLKLKIADYIIEFEASADGPRILPSVRFHRNICDDKGYDVHINLNSGNIDLPADAERVFHAPFVEEIDGIQIHHKTNFWSVWQHNSDLYIMTIFPLSSSARRAVLKFSLSEKEWDLWIDSSEKIVDPLEYPLDGLILYYLTVINNDIMIHASGVNYNGEGYLFSGISGKGKSTMAKLWDDFGARVIHDDRLIIRKTGDGFRMFNTPVYNNDDPHESPLNKIFLIEHGIENKLIRLKEASAVSMVMANCIQHSWGAGIISKLLESVSEICGVIPTYRLFFSPDRNVIDNILKNEE